MRAFLLLALCLCASCENTKIGDFSHTSLLKDVAYEKSPDGTVRYVSKTSEPATSNLIQEAGSTARAYIQGDVTKHMFTSGENVQTNRDNWEGKRLLKGTDDPDVVPPIPLDPNLPPP